MTHAQLSPDTPRPIEPGITVLRASAGTGKTFQLAHLVLRLVGEKKLPMREIAVVTFTRAATKELVDQVRRRLVDAELGLADLEAGLAPSGDDVLTAWCAAVPDIEATRATIRRALREFDQALISTIHSFCQNLLVHHAFETAAIFGLELEGSPDALCEEIVDDFLTGSVFASEDDAWRDTFIEHGRAGLLKLASKAIADYSMETVPAPVESSDEPAYWRAGFVELVRSEYLRRSKALGVVSFADLSRQLNEALRDAGPEEDLIPAVSARFSAVLVDEFQDTDDRQWRIFETLFRARDGHSPVHYLFLVGDAKQSIYGFRGANIRVYADACDGFDHEWPLHFNFRSDARLLAGLNTLFAAHQPHLDYFSDPSIRYTDVHPPEWRRDGSPLEVEDTVDESARAPIQVRYFDARSIRGAEAGKPIAKTNAEAILAEYAAADMTQLLTSGTRLNGRRLIASDLAVLVRSHHQGTLIQRALHARGVPAAVSAKQSVFASPLTGSIKLWLSALAQPGSQNAARLCAASPLFGWTGEDLSVIDSDPAVQLRWDAWRLQIKAWRAQFDATGFFRTFRAAMVTSQVTARVLRAPNGDRNMTDLLHMIDLIGDAESAGGLRLPGVMRWLDDPERANGDREENKIRLERDDASVRIMTVHKSKGLQFPIVYAPFLAVGSQPKPAPSDPFRAPRDTNGPERILELRREGELPSADAVAGSPMDAWQRRQLEEHRESLRLVYVALTRAKHRLILYTGHTRFLMHSGLGPLLHSGSDEASAEAPSRLDQTMARCPENAYGLPSSEMLRDDLLRLVRRAGGDISLRDCLPEQQVSEPYSQSLDTQELRVRPTIRHHLTSAWGRYSYSSLTRDLHGGTELYADDDELTDRHDEFDDPHQTLMRRTPPAPVPFVGPRITLHTYPGGAEAGSCLHEIFEHIDFRAPEKEETQAHFSAVITQQLERFGLPVPALRDELLQGVSQALLTPLSGDSVLEGICLADLAPSRRLNELDFLLPIRNDASCPLLRDELVDLMSTAVGQGPVTKAYVDSLKELRYERLTGFLNGSIDLVFAVSDRQGTDRYYLVDYKSNLLNLERDQNPVVQRYNHVWMADEMAYHHYILQYHLYSVALHRFLRHRIPDYAYERHFGGALYLFVRGMLGPTAPVQPTGESFGVFFHRPDPQLISNLDALFFEKPGAGR